MIISRTFARRRIAAGVRPGWFAAWSLVWCDAACLLLVFVLVWSPFRDMVEALNFPLWAVIAALIAVGFIPVQGVLIISSLWAAKSRWHEKDDDPGETR